MTLRRCKVVVFVAGFLSVLAFSWPSMGQVRGVVPPSTVIPRIYEPLIPQQSITIFDNKGGISIGSYNPETGSYFMSKPDGGIDIGSVDSQGNVTIHQYGGSGDD